MAKKTKAALEAEKLDVVADRGYFSSDENLACDEAGIMVTLAAGSPNSFSDARNCASYGECQLRSERTLTAARSGIWGPIR